MEFGSNEWISWHSTTPSLKTATTSDRLALMLFAGLSLCKTLNWLSHEAISLCNSILMFFQLMSKMWHSAAEVFVRTLGGPWQEQDLRRSLYSCYKQHSTGEFGPLLWCVQECRHHHTGLFTRLLLTHFDYLDDTSAIFIKLYDTHLVFTNLELLCDL